MNVYEYKTVLDEQRYPYIAEAAKYTVDGRKRIMNSPQKIAEFMGESVGLKYEAEEHFWAVAFNASNQLIGLFEISHGSIRATIVSPREIYQKLLMLGAVAWVAVHNHPSGNNSPSDEDKKLTTKMLEAGKLLDIALLDHIIIGDDYYSFRENGNLYKEITSV